MKVLTDISTNGKKIFKTIESGIWGSITGLIDDQLDLIAKLNEKLDKTGGTITGDLNVTGNILQNGVNIKLLPFPVGAIYQSNVATSPATLFGGTWVSLTDRALVGAGGSYANGATFGTVNHTLSLNEMPGHNHGGSYVEGGGTHWHNIAYGGVDSGQYIRLNANGSGSSYSVTWSGSRGNTPEVYATNAGYHGHGLTMVWNGAGWGHENRQPSRAVHQWYRSA